MGDDYKDDTIGMQELRRRANSMEPPPDEYTNPPGVGGEQCDTEEDLAVPEPCDPSEAEDLVMEESMPGSGIPGFEGEEVGGG